MAARSPSPNPSRPTSNNPLLRTPEGSSSSIRRSGGSFNHSKSSITAESLQRNSGCLRASLEQKENEREPNCSKTPKYSIVSSSKGVKNFMAPTISAASKFTAASPRKKILGERNEVISVFDSLELHPRGEVLTKFEMVSGTRTIRNEAMSAPNSLELRTKGEIPRKPEMGSGCQTVPDVAMVSNVSSAGVGDEEIETKSEAGSGFLDNLDDPVIKSHIHVAIPTCTPNPALSPLDADPSAQPYDRKSNYLSPRPQFLRYKPNPRFEQYRNKEREVPAVVGGGKQLEDSFSSESYEEASKSSEEAQSEPEEEESCLAVEDTELEDRKLSGNHPKSRSFIWYKVIPLLLVVLVGCLYAPISDSPVLSSSSPILKNFNGLATTRFRDWSSATVAYLTTKASPPKELGSFNQVNLTFSSMDQTVSSDLIFSTKKTETDWHLWHEMRKKSQKEVSQGNNENHEELEEIHHVYHVESTIEDDSSEEVKEEVREMEYKVVPEDVREEVHCVENEMENDDEEEFGKEAEETRGEEHKEVEYKAVPEDVKSEVHPVENETELMNEDGCVKESEQERSPSSNDDVQNVEEITGEKHKEVEYNVVPGDGTEKIQLVENDMESENEERILTKHIEEEIKEEHTHHGPEAIGVQDIRIQSVVSGDSLLGSPEEYQIPKDLESRELSDLRSDMLSVRSMLGVSLAVIVLAASVFLRMKPNQTTVVAQKVFLYKEMASVSGSSENYNDGKGSPCEPAELSSLHSTPYSGQQKDSGRLRRDSEASSSISYGSFTTYERVSAKKGCRDDEVVTPVRRSSRIRNLVTSP